jgi:hypothetical protein
MALERLNLPPVPRAARIAIMEPALVRLCLTLGLTVTTARHGMMLWSSRHGGGEERSETDSLEWGVDDVQFWPQR